MICALFTLYNNKNLKINTSKKRRNRTATRMPIDLPNATRGASMQRNISMCLEKVSPLTILDSIKTFPPKM